MKSKDFCVFILTHGRPEKVYTYKTLKRQGYTGPLFLVIDNEDKTADQYIQKFGRDNVITFDKLAQSKKFDEFDNFDNRKAIVYARNACFDIAEWLGYEYFLQLDDDYTEFKFRINGDLEHPTGFFTCKNTLDDVFRVTLNYYKSIPVKTIAFSQGGDWFGGGTNFNKKPKRKAMNSFFCSINRKFDFVGRINEDVNTYTSLQNKGEVMFSIPFIQLDQLQTQSNQGGMTETYIDGGTYIKSFYTIICSPNSCKIKLMGRTNQRLHHSINWDNTAAKIIREKHKK